MLEMAHLTVKFQLSINTFDAMRTEVGVTVCCFVGQTKKTL